MNTLSQLRRELVADLAPRRLLPTLAAGLVVGGVVVIVTISFAALVCGGTLERFVGVGMGLALSGATILAVLVALTSSYRRMVATPQDSTAAVLALIAASIVTAFPATADERTTLLTVVAAIATTTVLTPAPTGGLRFSPRHRPSLGRSRSSPWHSCRRRSRPWRSGSTVSSVASSPTV